MTEETVVPSPDVPEPAPGRTARDSLDLDVDSRAPGDPGPRRRWSAGIVLVAAVAVVAILIAAIAGAGEEETPTTGTVLAPNIVGMSIGRATAVVEAQGLVLGESVVIQTTALPEGTVTAQSPAAGIAVPAGAAIIPTVSTARGLVTVPDVAGQTAAEAVVTLTSVGLDVGPTETITDTSAPAGDVVMTRPPAGRQVAADTPITLVVLRARRDHAARLTRARVPSGPVYAPRPVGPAARIAVT